MNPCTCGYANDPEKECTCSPTLISCYQKRLSGPQLDRIDMHIEVPRLPFHTCPSAPPRAVPRGKLSDDRRGEPSAAIRSRVEREAGMGFGGRVRLIEWGTHSNDESGWRHIANGGRLTNPIVAWPPKRRKAGAGYGGVGMVAG